MFARQQTQDNCLFYLLSSTYSIVCFFFTCIHTSSCYYCENGKCEIDISNRINEENCLPRRIHTFLVHICWITLALLAFFVCTHHEKKGGLAQKWVHSNELWFCWLEPYFVFGINSITSVQIAQSNCFLAADCGGRLCDSIMFHTRSV